MKVTILTSLVFLSTASTFASDAISFSSKVENFDGTFTIKKPIVHFGSRKYQVRSADKIGLCKALGFDSVLGNSTYASRQPDIIAIQNSGNIDYSRTSSYEPGIDKITCFKKKKLSKKVNYKKRVVNSDGSETIHDPIVYRGSDTFFVFTNDREGLCKALGFDYHMPYSVYNSQKGNILYIKDSGDINYSKTSFYEQAITRITCFKDSDLDKTVSYKKIQKNSDRTDTIFAPVISRGGENYFVRQKYSLGLCKSLGYDSYLHNSTYIDSKPDTLSIKDSGQINYDDIDLYEDSISRLTCFNKKELSLKIQYRRRIKNLDKSDTIIDPHFMRAGTPFYVSTKDDEGLCKALGYKKTIEMSDWASKRNLLSITDSGKVEYQETDFYENGITKITCK